MSTVLPRAWPPMWRMTSWATALLLILAGAWVTTWLSIDASRRPFFAEPRHTVVTAPVAQTASRSATASATPTVVRRLPSAALVLVSMAAAVGMAGLLLAATQRGWADMALGGAGLLWAVQTALSGRKLFGVGATAPVALSQALLAVAIVLMAWYGLKLIQRPTRRPRHLPLGRAVLVGLVLASLLALLGWLPQPVLEWIVPLSGLALGLGALMQGVELARRRRVSQSRHSAGAWLLVGVTAVTLGCGVHELSLRSLWPAGAEALVDAWYATRLALLGLLTTMLMLRLAQLARMLRQLGRSHRNWRAKLRQTQRDLADVRDQLTLRERTDGQRQQRDRILREVHDELGHRLALLQGQLQRAGLPSEPQDIMATSLQELQMAYDALEPVPRPLADALATLRQQVEPALLRAGVRLNWSHDNRAALLVLPTAQTLQLLRIVREALDLSQPHSSVVQGQGEVLFALEVLDGETGRHLHLRIGTAGAPAVRTSGRALAPSWIKLQRQATMLGAQLVVEGGASTARSLELVMPLARPR